MAHVELAIVVDESKPDPVKPASPPQNITIDFIIFGEVHGCVKLKSEGDNVHLVPICNKSANARLPRVIRMERGKSEFVWHATSPRMAIDLPVLPEQGK